AYSRTQSGATSPGAASASESEPAKVEEIPGTDLKRVTLSSEAAERIGIATAPVRDEQVGGVQRKVIPFAAVLYDAEGRTWTFTSSEPLVFVRQPIKVDHIDGDRAVLTEGPASGTAVVTVGAAELLGAEYGVEEE
ncbi:MAG: hypothetical protein IRY97_07075, partial [Thermomicrobiaceae bacterium]|nr:hypothetical protein [Thermomicrobiaceae bacterium]